MPIITITPEMVEKEKQKKKEKWFKENSPKSQLLGDHIFPLSPDLGFYVTVNGLEISEEFFEEEFEQISNAYDSVMKKLDEYYKNNK